MRDPDVEIEIPPDTGEWLPLSYRQDSAGLFQEAQIDIYGDLVRASDRFVKDIQRFLKLWDRNIVSKVSSKRPKSYSTSEFWRTLTNAVWLNSLVATL